MVTLRVSIKGALIHVWQQMLAHSAAAEFQHTGSFPGIFQPEYLNRGLLLMPLFTCTSANCVFAVEMLCHDVFKYLLETLLSYFAE